MNYQFKLNSNEIYTCTYSNPLIIKNPLDSDQLIDLIIGEIQYLIIFHRLEDYLISPWKDELKIELVYYKLEII